MSTIRVENLSKSFGSVQALSDVSFEIPAGEFVVMLGISGAGKSTLLRCMTGLTRPTEGAVYIDDEEVTGPREDVAMIFQQHNIIGQMSAYGNALTGALGRTDFVRSALQMNSKEDKMEALEALDAVGLLDQAQQQTRRMSGGQQQRVGIARALVQKPKIMLADEPVASLDPSSSRTVMRYLRDAAEDRDITSIVSLHQVDLAREFGVRFLGLKEGELLFDGYQDDFDLEVVDEIYDTLEHGYDDDPDPGDDAQVATGSSATDEVVRGNV
ncbi:phosphonate ABC transporter ATP-binding protein [Natronorarus salvus]|uniref:phosphonate ABC transporter ATP-binding protein n=1 Tax=Natronorarus salvus TaxID=3117733 RepID=UPI002F26D3EC